MSYFFGVPLSMQPMGGDYVVQQTSPPEVESFLLWEENYTQEGIYPNDYLYDIWPPAFIIGGFWGNHYDFSSLPALATVTGSFTSALTYLIAGDIPAWTANVELSCHSWSVSGDMPAWTPSAHIYSGDVISVEGDIPAWSSVIEILGGHVNITGNILLWSMSSTIQSGEIISVAGDIPLWRGSITLSHDVGAFDVEGEIPLWRSSIRFRETLSLYGATVMNATNFAVTEYAEYPVSSLGYMNGKYYGTLSDGIYLLEGKDDNGTDIVAEAETGVVDFGMGFMKRLREAWFVLRADGTVTLRVVVDEQNAYERELDYLNEQIREGRVKIAKGHKKRFYAFGVKNNNGSDFDLSSIRVMVDQIREKQR